MWVTFRKKISRISEDNFEKVLVNFGTFCLKFEEILLKILKKVYESFEENILVWISSVFLKKMWASYNRVLGTKGTLEVTTLFFSHSGNTEATKFCTCSGELYCIRSLSEFDKFYTCLVCVMINWKETLLSDREVQNVYFLTIKDNSGVKIHRCLCTAYREENVKPGIHLRQRQTEAQCGSLPLASIDDTINRATCFRGCCDPSHWLLVYQSEASPRNSPPHAQYGWNTLCLTETETQFSVRHGAARHAKDAMLCLGLSLPLMYSWLNEP